MADARLSAVSNFTPTKLSKVPAYLQPDKHSLPSPFVACIIGASEGIGEHIAYGYARAGATGLILCARRLPKLEPVKQRAQSYNASMQVEVHECDISLAASVEKLAAFVRGKFGRLDALVPNAAYAGPVTLQMHLGEPKDVQQAFDTNAMGTYHAAHYFVPLLLESENGARQFIAVGSLAGLIRRGIIANMGYTISKMAQIRMIEYLEEQYGKEGLFVVAVHPGAVATSMAEGNTPEAFIPYLVDEVDLCGAFCVALSAKGSSIKWLSGRLLSANWDFQEMLAKKDEIVEKDLLKFVMEA